MDITEDDFRKLSKVYIAACGTSWHAGLAGKFMIERLARLPVEVDYASEYRYRDPLTGAGDLDHPDHAVGRDRRHDRGDARVARQGRQDAWHLQRGGLHDRARIERNDLHACGAGDRRGFDQGVHRAADGAVPVRGVPGAGARNATAEESTQLLEELTRDSGEARGAADAATTRPKNWRRNIIARQDFLFLGRGIHYPIALEGALKLKEISYIHAEGYPAGEMKHGPNALIDEELPVVMLATRDRNDPGSVLRYEKTLSNLKEVKARSGTVIADRDRRRRGDSRSGRPRDLHVPQAPELLAPILEVVPLQLLAYHIAVRRGCDVDQPRNLAKSVTVE